MAKKWLLCVLISSLPLAGCVPALVGASAAGASGATYYNRNAISQFFDDSDITKTAYRKIQRDPRLMNGTHIIVAAKNGYVLLAGQVTDPSQKQEAEAILGNVDGIKKIYNQITVSGPSSSLVRSSDSWITTKIKSQLVVAKNVPSNQIKVVTENGVVYLMGVNVSADAANTAVNIARQVTGVQEVVKLFETV